jgi:hypothetical protein
LVTVIAKVAGEPILAFVNCAVMLDPDEFTVVTEGCKRYVGVTERFTTALGVKFAPRMVSVKLLGFDGTVPGGRLGGVTCVMNGTAAAGTVCARATEQDSTSARTPTLAIYRLIRIKASRQTAARIL